MKDNNLTKLYKSRFTIAEENIKKNVWKILTKFFFQKYLSNDASVLDVACGNGEFINYINAKYKFAVDLNPESKLFLHQNITLINEDIFKAIKILLKKKLKFNLIFCSNFLEHLSKKEDLVTLLNSLKNILADDGIIIIMGPNYKYSYKNYWDFFDHHIPLTDQSLIELLDLTGYKIIEKYPKFLPFSTKSLLPKNKIFIYIYLKIKLLWFFFGKQFLFVVTK